MHREKGRSSVGLRGNPYSLNQPSRSLEKSLFLPSRNELLAYFLWEICGVDVGLFRELAKSKLQAEEGYQDVRPPFWLNAKEICHTASDVA